MNISTMWFYAILVSAVCGGYGMGAYSSPSEEDIARAARVAHDAAIQECVTPQEKAFTKGKITNSPGKEY